MPFFGVPIRNGLPIGLGSVAGFGVQQFDPSQLFAGGTVAGAWYDPSDLSTMFTTSAGTTPVAMPGQGSAVSVGLMLDKSQGLVLGSELAGSILGGTSGWTFVGAATVSGGAIVFTTPPSTNASAQYNPIVSSGLWYRVQVTLTGTGQVNVQLGSAGTSATLVAPGSYTINGRASGGTPTVLTFSSVLSSVNNFVGSVTAISVRELPGNHAIAFNDTTARPELRARVNLLTYSEQFDNAAWVRTQFNVTANAALAPDGTQTADLLAPTSPATTSFVIQTTAATSGQVRLSYFAKQNTGRYFVIVRGPYSNFDYAVFDLQSGTVTLQPTFAGSSAIISPENNGYYRCTLISSQATGTQAFSISDSASGLGSGTGGSVFLWGADLRPANIGANVPAYQRISDANTYDTSGFPLYLRFDGIDDSMYTPANLNLSGTDKATVFAGVRKNADVSIISEFSANAGLSNGAFLLATGGWGAENGTYVRQSRGTVTSFAQPATNSYPSPQTNVLTGTSDIVGDSVVLRINGAQVATSATDQGSGNYGTYPLYIGARNNASTWFNGHLHSLIIAGSAVSAGNISATEQWVAGKVGIVIP